MDLPLRALIQQAEFKDSFRGYDRNQVDDLLEHVADRVGELEAALTEAEARAAAPDAATSADIERQVEERVQAELAQRPPAAASGDDDASEALRRTLVLAQRTADAAIAEAREEADRLLAEARQEADGLTAEARADAERRRAEAREHLVVEINELEAIRETLRGDVALLEHHVGGQRDEVRQSLARLQELLDDPASFRVEPAPPVQPVNLPEPEPLEVVPENDASDGVEDESPLEHELEPILEGDAIPQQANPAIGTATLEEVDSVEADQPEPDPPAAEVDAADDDDIPWPSVLAGEPAGPAGPPPLVFDAETAVDHEEPGAFGARFDDITAEDGPLTEAIESIDARSEEDAFLAELRRAMADEGAAGEGAADALPTEAVPPVDQGQEASLFDQDQADEADGRPRSRFGRRR